MTGARCESDPREKAPWMGNALVVTGNAVALRVVLDTCPLPYGLVCAVTENRVVTYVALKASLCGMARRI